MLRSPLTSGAGGCCWEKEAEGRCCGPAPGKSPSVLAWEGGASPGCKRGQLVPPSESEQGVHCPGEKKGEEVEGRRSCASCHCLGCLR